MKPAGRSGRGGGGRFPHGRGRGRGKSSPNNKKKEKVLKDCVFCLHNPKFVNDHHVASKFLINYIKKTYTNGRDIADALRLEKDMDFTDPLLKPRLKQGSEPDEAKKKIEDEELSTECEDAVSAFRKRRER